MNSKTEYPFKHIPYPTYSANTDSFTNWIITTHIVTSKWFKTQINKIYRSSNLNVDDGYQQIILELLELKNKTTLIEAFLNKKLNYWLIRFTQNQKFYQIQKNESYINKNQKFYQNIETTNETTTNYNSDEELLVKQLLNKMLQNRDKNWLIANTYIHYCINNYNVSKTSKELNINRTMINKYIKEFENKMKTAIKKYENNRINYNK